MTSESLDPPKFAKKKKEVLWWRDLTVALSATHGDNEWEAFRVSLRLSGMRFFIGDPRFWSCPDLQATQLYYAE